MNILPHDLIKTQDLNALSYRLDFNIEFEGHTVIQRTAFNLSKCFLSPFNM
jgi:hypothetical protein